MRIEAGRFRGRPLPRAREARPVGGRVRTSLFSVLAAWLPDARVLDLFAGVGALGLEALSRGAARIVLVERDRGAVRALRAWLDQAGARAEAEVLERDALRGPLPAGPFDLVFVDPPFAQWGRPAVGNLLGRAVEALAPEGLVVLKVPAHFEPPPDPRWDVVRRRDVGSVAWILLAAPSPPADV